MTDGREAQWANPGALGLAGFGFNTILLQLFNLGLIESYIPLVYGFFWGGIAQVIAGIIDGRRGDTFGLTAFTSYGAFWLGLSLFFLLEWNGVYAVDANGLGWLCIMWAIFTAYMAVGTFKMSVMHVTVFVSLTILFILLAVHFIAGMTAVVPGLVGLFVGASAVYGSMAVIWNDKYGRWVLPIGLLNPKK